MSDALCQTLPAPGPHESLGKHADTYGRVIGAWAAKAENRVFGVTGSLEIHFSWVLEGRAVQDTWITPARAERTPGTVAKMDWYGTTIRVFDPKSECWRATWWNPVVQRRVDLEGRRIGDDIVQIGARDGWPVKWVFSEIAARSFTWTGYVLEHDGATWKTEVVIHARRTSE